MILSEMKEIFLNLSNFVLITTKFVNVLLTHIKTTSFHDTFMI